MAKKKDRHNSQPKKKSENKSSFIELIKGLGILLDGIASPIVLVNQIVQISNGNTQQATLIIAGAALVFWLLFLGWASFGRGTVNRQFWRWAARIALVITFVGLVSGGIVWQYQQQLVAQENQKRVIVVIAQFDGPEETYGFRNQILEELNASLGGDKDIKIIPINETVTIAQGSNYARQLGKQHQADLVFWGWYRPTENPNLTLHIENLSPAKFSILQESKTYKPEASLAELQSFSLQQKIGQQTSALISFLSGLLFYQANKYDMAITRFQQALNQPEESNEIFNQSDAYIYFANAYFRVRDYQKAVINFGSAIRINPKNAYAYHNRGAAYMAQGQYPQAIADFNQAIQIDPQNSYFYIGRGIVYGIQGQFTQAITDFDQAIKIDPQNAYAYSNRGTVYADLGQYTQAIADFDQAIKIDPQNGYTSYFNRGKVYADQKQYEQAIDDYNQAIKIDPQSVFAYIGRGAAYAGQGQYQQAIIDFDHATKIDPQNALAYYNLGRAYYDLKQYKQSIIYYTQAIQINLQYTNAYIDRGVAYAAQGQYAQAIDNYNQAINIDPQNTYAYISRGAAYAGQEQYPQAITDFNYAIQTNPQSGDAYFNRGLAYSSQEQYAQAIDDFSHAIQINPKDAEAYCKRGLTNQLLGDQQQADADFGKCKELAGQ